ncbi:MAG TPA: ferritin-like domain-containing protein [Streptosporangiaceae bacterium]|nr:ferritin-like domain-containing protein [Streptosporangiaceae bacterium]
MKAKAEVAALQSALQAEEAASYGYGVVGAHLSGAAFSQATSDCVIHERARDSLSAMITALGATPEPAAVAYRLPLTVSTPAQAATLAVDLELSVVAGYVPLAGAAEPSLRQLAATRMQAAAVRAARWGAPPRSFPGLSPAP